MQPTSQPRLHKPKPKLPEAPAAIDETTEVVVGSGVFENAPSPELDVARSIHVSNPGPACAIGYDGVTYVISSGASDIQALPGVNLSHFRSFLQLALRSRGCVVEGA